MSVNKTNKVLVNNDTNRKDVVIMLTKNMIREELKKVGIELSNTQFRSTKRDELLKMLTDAGTHQVVATDHAYYDEKHVEFEGSLEHCKEYIEANHDPSEGGDSNLVSYTIVPVGDNSVDKFYPKSQKSNTFDKLPIALINKLLGELHSRRRRFDSRGLIDTKEVYRAVRASVYGELTDYDIKKYINTMVVLGYITFKNNGGHLQLFLTFKDVVIDDNKVTGVRW